MAQNLAGDGFLEDGSLRGGGLARGRGGDLRGGGGQEEQIVIKVCDDISGKISTKRSNEGEDTNPRTCRVR